MGSYPPITQVRIFSLFVFASPKPSLFILYILSKIGVLISWYHLHYKDRSFLSFKVAPLATLNFLRILYFQKSTFQLHLHCEEFLRF